MLQILWQQWCKYSIGLTNHTVFHPMIPLSWQRLLANSLGLNPLLLPSGVDETELPLGSHMSCRFTVADCDHHRVMVFFHGGGFTTGSISSHRPMCRHLAKACRTPVYSIDYRLAPEHPFPAALDDCEAAVQALMTQLHLPPQHVILAGDSAGGNLALSTALRLRQQGQSPAAIMLLSPWTDPADTNLPWVFDPIINPLWAWASAQAYRGNTDAHNPEFAPLNADLHGLPPVLLQAGKEEILLPQIKRLADKLRASNVPLTFTVYDHLWHSGQMTASISHDSARAVRQCGAFVAQLGTLQSADGAMPKS